MAKIQMKTPLVEMDGDEMTRIIWKMIKDILLTPYIDLKTEYYDLGLEHEYNPLVPVMFYLEIFSYSIYKTAYTPTFWPLPFYRIVFDEQIVFQNLLPHFLMP